MEGGLEAVNTAVGLCNPNQLHGTTPEDLLMRFDTSFDPPSALWGAGGPVTFIDVSRANKPVASARG